MIFSRLYLPMVSMIFFTSLINVCEQWISTNIYIYVKNKGLLPKIFHCGFVIIKFYLEYILLLLVMWYFPKIIDCPVFPERDKLKAQLFELDTNFQVSVSNKNLICLFFAMWRVCYDGHANRKPTWNIYMHIYIYIYIFIIVHFNVSHRHHFQGRVFEQVYALKIYFTFK